MDENDQKALMYVLAREMKKYHHQTIACRAALQVIKDSGFPGVDELVDSASQSPESQAVTDRAFAFLDEWLPPIPEVDLQTVQRLWLEKWESGEKKPN